MLELLQNPGPLDTPQACSPPPPSSQPPATPQPACQHRHTWRPCEVRSHKGAATASLCCHQQESVQDSAATSHSPCSGGQQHPSLPSTCPQIHSHSPPSTPPPHHSTATAAGQTKAGHRNGTSSGPPELLSAFFPWGEKPRSRRGVLEATFLAKGHWEAPLLLLHQPSPSPPKALQAGPMSSEEGARPATPPTRACHALLRGPGSLRGLGQRSLLGWGGLPQVCSPRAGRAGPAGRPC